MRSDSVGVEEVENVIFFEQELAEKEEVGMGVPTILRSQNARGYGYKDGRDAHPYHLPSRVRALVVLQYRRRALRHLRIVKATLRRAGLFYSEA